MPRVVGGREVTAVMAEKGGSEAHGEYEKTGDHDEDCNKNNNKKLTLVNNVTIDTQLKKHEENINNTHTHTYKAWHSDKEIEDLI